MITKAYIPGETKSRVQVTFTVPGTIWAERIELALGRNNELVIEPLKMTPTGDWTLTIELPAGEVYRFHYLCDEQQWMGEVNADGYEPDAHDGSFVCLLDTRSAEDYPCSQTPTKALPTPSAFHQMIAVGGR